MASKLTVENILAMPPGSVLWDSTVRGFGCRRQRDRARVYFLKYRIGRQQRWFTIGRHGSPWNTTTARVEAKRLLGEIAHGRDPARQRADEKAAGTFTEFAVDYLDWARGHKKAGSVRGDETNLRLHLLPRLGRLRVTEITPADVARLHHAMAGTPGAANRCLALLSKAMNLAEKWGLRPLGSNPCRHADKYREGRRERFLSDAELQRLGNALRRAETRGANPWGIAAIRLLALTGARRGEIQGLKWSEVDLERQTLRLTDSKTGEKTIRLNAPAVAILSKLPKVGGNPHVIPGTKRGAPFASLFELWNAIRSDAKLPGLRLHDLRHSFASVGTGKGLSLRMIGSLLGHSQPTTTQRYAHLADDPAQAASEAIAGHIAAAMAGTSADVVPMKGARRRK